MPEPSDPSLPHDAPTRLGRQRSAVEAWLATDDARATADRLLRRWGLDVAADDLIAEAWIRVREAFDRRDEPYPDLDGPTQAARFGARVLDNLRRDRQRRIDQRREVQLVEATLPEIRDPSGDADTRLLLQALLGAIGSRASAGVACAGCPDEVVAATALEVVHLVLAGHDGHDRGRDWMDQMLHLALERVDGDTRRSPAAANQRKSRCGRCVRQLLVDGAQDLMGTPA